MFRLSLRNIWSRKGRLLLTAIAVIAGTAFLNGVFVFTDTIKGAFNTMFENAYAGTDAYVRSANVIEGQFGQDQRDRIEVGAVDTVRGVAGVVEAEGAVNGTATVVYGETVLGIDGPPKFAGAWFEGKGSPWTIAEGRAPSGPNEVVLDVKSSRLAKVPLGATVTITSRGAPQQFEVVGTALFAGNETSGGASWSLFTLPTAQEFIAGDTTKIDAVVVRGDGSMSQGELAGAIQAALGDPSIEVLTGQQITDESKSNVATSLSFITLFLTIFAIIALFVGSFIIYNVFSISAAQRQRENALLRAIGASRSQVTRSMFFEAFVVGVGGSALGCIGGVGLAATILKALGAVGFAPSGTSLVVRSNGFVVTMIVGVIVTVLCSVVPALRAGRVPPLAAMRDVAIDTANVSRGRKITGAVAVVLAVACVVWGITGTTVALGGGVAFLFLALVALAPFVATPVARLFSPLLTRLRGAAGTMAGRNAARNPKRTALTASALAVGLALLIGVATLGASAKATTRAVVGSSFKSDYIVSARQGNNGGSIPATVAADVQATGVGDALGFGGSAIKVLEKGEYNSKVVVALDPTAASKVLDVPFVFGGFTSLDPSTILVSKKKADRDGLTEGSVLDTQLLDGSSVKLTVAGVYDSDLFGNLIVDRALFASSPIPVFDQAVIVHTPDGVTAANTSALEKLVASYPTLKLESREQFIDSQSGQIDGFLNFIYALLGISIFIAVVGIVITLLLAVYERRRELGLLRAVGMTRKQVRTSVLWESLITAVVGVIIGVVLGGALGWIIVRALRDQGLDKFSFPTSTVVVSAVVSLVLAALAAFLPARRAANADVLEAIATT